MTGERSESIKDRIHRQLQEQKGLSLDLYHTFIAQSAGYKNALDLNQADLENLEHLQDPAGMYPELQDYKGFVSLEVKCERFILAVRNVCGAPYDRSWSHEIMASCVTNQGLNRQTGRGTSLINVIPGEYHSAILRHLREEG